ncbi:MAG: type III-A CRISPR-associated RAMP protein Csm5 [Candidatus Viridilinea halotolerans]|uniref:CRISPR system Cms protein Csm5 n=1 Tax=Candidatus Viridilinea halotolerans TaxID=2491704 RepID=A0A426TWC6_9CHLR|nr:MAG: type III-A CRISPR-associated RAMP protein Csm5 [Candidatus Viridilinea halotolerans]
MKHTNQVCTLQIEVLAPLHISSGARLLPDVDYYSNAEHTYIIDSDVALDLAWQRWEAGQLSPEEQRRAAEEELTHGEERLVRRCDRYDRDLAQFPKRPADRRKIPDWEKRKDRLVEEKEAIKVEAARLKARHAELSQMEFMTEQGLPDELVANSGFADLLATKLLREEDLQSPPEGTLRPLVRYAMRGTPATGEIYEQIKDIADRPYMPGSSLKGAIRSALAWELAPQLAANELGILASGGAKGADNRIEEGIFLGRDLRRMNATVRDVMRTLHVGDSRALERGRIELASVAIFRSQSQANARIALEVIPAGTQMEATLQIEQYPFTCGEALKVLDFGAWKERMQPAALAAICRRRAAALIEGEQSYFARLQAAAEVARFYQELKNRLAGMGPESFLLPLGWGAGWRSKTLDTRLRGEGAADEPFVQAVHTFKLKKHKSLNFQAGGDFPQTRKVVMAGERIMRPLGWVEVRME